MHVFTCRLAHVRLSSSLLSEEHQEARKCDDLIQWCGRVDMQNADLVLHSLRLVSFCLRGVSNAVLSTGFSVESWTSSYLNSQGFHFFSFLEAEILYSQSMARSADARFICQTVLVV